MVKVFSCGHQSTVQPFKQTRTFKVTFACQKCLKEGAINIGAAKIVFGTESVAVGSHTICLVTKRQARVVE